jgi:hypothetical protein
VVNIKHQNDTKMVSICYAVLCGKKTGQKWPFSTSVQCQNVTSNQHILRPVTISLKRFLITFEEFHQVVLLVQDFCLKICEQISAHKTFFWCTISDLKASNNKKDKGLLSLQFSGRRLRAGGKTRALTSTK